MASASVRWSAVGRALPGEPVSGDEYVAQAYEGGMLLGVIDGLGHGAEAHRAARQAADMLTAHAGTALVSLMNGCHEALLGTRGVAMSLVAIDAREDRLEWLGVGNVEGVLLRTAADGGRARRRGALTVPQRERLLLRGGVVGYQLPTLRVSESSIQRGDTLVLATDGIKRAFLEDLHSELGVEGLADHVLKRHQRSTDDALVLVAAYAGTEEEEGYGTS